jgi:hypothetical protein
MMPDGGDVPALVLVMAVAGWLYSKPFPLVMGNADRFGGGRIHYGRDESGVDNFRIRSESELCGYGEEYLISMRIWIIRIRLCADADYDMVLVISDGYGLSDN